MAILPNNKLQRLYPLLIKKADSNTTFYKKGVIEMAFLAVNVLFNKVVALLFIPFIQAKLGRDAYVLYDFYLTLVTLGISLFLLGIDSGVIRYLEQERQRRTIQQLFSTGAAFGGLNILLLSSGSFLLYALLYNVFPSFMFLSLPFAGCIVLNTIIVAFQSYLYSLLRWMGRTHIASISNIVIPVSSILPSSLYFFLGDDVSLYVFLMIYFAGGLVGTALVLTFFYRLQLLKFIPFETAAFRTIFRFSFPLGLNS